MPIPVNQRTDIHIGDTFENCAFKPCVCVEIDDDVVGYRSLIPGESQNTGYCSITHCALRLLSKEEVQQWILSGPNDTIVSIDEKWW